MEEVKSRIILDLDGTLSKYPGSDFRSLFTKYKEIHKKDISGETAGQLSAEIMINRYGKYEIKTLLDNIKYLYDKYGTLLLLLSLNYKIVAIKYLQEIGVSHFFDFTLSKFREDLSDYPNKKDVWVTIIKDYSNIIYIDDDNNIIKYLQKFNQKVIKDLESKKIKFIHVKEWLGSIKIEDLLK